MSQSSHRLGVLLSFSWAYRLFRWLIGAQRMGPAFVGEYIRPAPGMRVLDLGCGPADVLEHLPDLRYVGVDLSEDYIQTARARHGARGHFMCCDVADLPEEFAGPYDRILALGLLHHLEDAEARRLLETCSRLLAKNGMLVTLDGCYRDGQGRWARFFLDRDRGRRVRDREGYLKLAEGLFGSVEAHLREDLLNLPYTHLILQCRVSTS